MSRNTAIFVDVANVFYAAKAAGVDIDYVTLLKTVTANRDLVRAYAYTGLDPDNDNQKAFHNFLDRNNYTVVSKDVRKYGDGRFKANLDIELVVDLVRLAPKLDIAIVVSGDGDFAPAIKAVQDMGVRVEVVSFRANTSSDLIDVADQFIEITSIAKVEAGGSRSGRRVAADGEEDLSMTEVPGKQSESPARPRRRGAEEERPRGGRGRNRGGASSRIASSRGTTLRVGDRLIDADSIETFTLDDLDSDDLGAAPVAGRGYATRDDGGDEGRRRRRRRGGRGRRGRGGSALGMRGAVPGGDEIETLRIDDLYDDAPGDVPEYMAGSRSAGGRPASSPASRRSLGSGPSRIADEVARSHKDDDFRDGDGMSDVSPDVQALLRSQLASTGRAASSAPALTGEDAASVKGGRGGARGGRTAAKPAAKRPAAKKPAAKRPAAKVAMVKKPTRPKAKGSKGA